MRAIFNTMLLCLFLSQAFSACCHAGGRIAGVPNPLAGTIAFNAWCRDGAIQFAVCNLGDGGQNITAAVGCYDTMEHLLGSQSFPVEAKTIKVVNFPVMTRPTPRGDTQLSDTAFVFVESGGKSVEVGSMSIQRVYPSPWDVSMDSYLVEAGTKVLLTCNEPSSAALRMVFIAKEAFPADMAGSGEIAEGTAPTLTLDSLKGLGLVPQAVQTYSELLKDNHGFVIGKGKSGRINISYTTGAVDGCKPVHISIARHIVDPADGTGGGMGPTFLVYDPKVITLKPVLQLTTVTKSTEYTFGGNEPVVPSGPASQATSLPVDNATKH